ncbi:MAG TPA: UTP--glucose-1-phosphate uridylyltransferase GalU [Phycisphaerae bacterium]|nr:UTP--glucose-1-phosphate uridylyltransferase GalU [Phycisphaerae bacterium]
MTITKAVIPAAGKGTRFLPATKAQPKEMLPVIDKPTIQYVVEEAIDAGLTDILIITSREKRAVEDHFDRNSDLEQALANSDKNEEYEQLRRLSDLANVHYIRQKEPRGLGDAVYYARHHVGDEPFAVLLGDSIVTAPSPCIGQLIEVYRRYQSPVVGLEQVPREAVGRYGIVGGDRVDERTYRLTELVEKPECDQAPSTLAIGARYILTPDIFAQIEQTPPGKGNEIQLTDALQRLLAHREMFGYHFEGQRHDIGNKLDYLRTTVLFALDRPDLGPAFRAFLREVARDL